MSDCCSKHNHKTQRHTCPGNNKEYGQVLYKTLLHHVKSPWHLALKEQVYYFCSDPDCHVVYFSHDNSVIEKSQIRTKVGIKEISDEALVCYCFGVSKATAKTDEKVKTFVIEQTKKSLCACAIRNPSGKCCIKDFPIK